MTATAAVLPDLVVSSLNHRWRRAGTTSLYVCGDRTDGPGDGPPWGPTNPQTLQQIDDAFGPWRPVVPPSDRDLAQLGDAFAIAGRATISSIASALALVFYEARDRSLRGGATWANSFAYAKRTLLAGSSECRASDLLMTVVLIGADLNDHMRFDQPMRTSRSQLPQVEPAARDRIAEVLRRWSASSGFYTEVLHNLAQRVSTCADQRFGANGWIEVAGIAPGQSVCARIAYQLFYWASEHSDAELL